MGEWEQAIARSRGGRTSNIHRLADGRGRPSAFALTPGNIVDTSMALDPLALKHAMHPGPIKIRLLNGDDRLHLAGQGLRLLL